MRAKTLVNPRVNVLATIVSIELESIELFKNIAAKK